MVYQRRVRFLFLISFLLPALVTQPRSARADCLDPPGDVNGSGVTNVADLQCLVLASLWTLGGGTAPFPACVQPSASPEALSDQDCDGALDVTDVLIGAAFALQIPLSAQVDADGDGCADACQADADGDGFLDDEDCAPDAPLIHPDAVEVCNGVDDDCDGGVDEASDPSVAASCDDGDPCNGLETCAPPGPGSGGAPTNACLPGDACVGAGCPHDGDGDGVFDACDPCPQDNPNDANGDGICDSGAVCPCGYAGPPACTSLAVTVLQAGYAATVVSSCLPKGTQDIEVATDGNVYGVTNLVSGPGPGEGLFKADLATGSAVYVGSFNYANPASADPFRVDQGPGGSFGTKLYATDWIAGTPARIDRVLPDLAGHEVVFATNTGAPFHTPTSNLLFSAGGAYGTFAYLAAQSGSSMFVYRFGPVLPANPASWASISGVQDIRALAFGPGGAFGTGLYAVTSTVINGFVGAPGAIHVLSATGQATTFVPQSAGLEFGMGLLFDTVGLFGGDLFYTQAGGALVRITSAGAKLTFATGVGASGPEILPDGALLIAAGRALIRIAPTGM